MIKRLLFSCMVVLGGLFTACQDDNEIFLVDVIGEEDPEALHMRFRDQPYPKEGNTLYLNPPPLLVPEEVRADDGFLEFELSQDMTFQSEGTFRSGQLPYNFYNVHQQLATGDWYWRYRAVSATGESGPWSEVLNFTVTDKLEVFVTPPFETVKQHIPAPGQPRVVCFLEEDLKALEPITSTHPAYKRLVRAGLDYTFSESDPFGIDMKGIYTALRTIQAPEYDAKLREYAHQLGGYVPTENQMNDIYTDDFTAADVMNIYTTLYETYYDELSESEKNLMETVMLNTVTTYYENNRGALEAKMFDNHSWQVGIQGITQAAFMICDKYPEAMQAFEYMYELWTARAPATGFNHDGSWINGNNYFSVNFITLYYMPMLFSYLTDVDFLQHPWYRNAGKSMIFSWLPGSESASFGDGVGKYGFAVYNQAAFADFLAREIHDPYAAWYANECERIAAENPAVESFKVRETNLRLYRIAREHLSYETEQLEDSELEGFSWNKDAGYGTAYSNMSAADNVTLAFRSSPFGAGSHTLADQNSFKLLYKGRYVYTNVGRYGDPDKYGAAHDILQYRNTRGHNTVMINNIGQPFTTKAYGEIKRGLNGDHLAYFLGDASHAYCGTSDYWEDRFQVAGLEQSPAYGFGDNPLNTYKRHIFMLRPNKIVIYDELRADEAATWQWLLHSPTRFHINGNKLTTTYQYEGTGTFQSVAQVFSEEQATITQTDKWFPGGEPIQVIDPRPWHLTVEYGLTDGVKSLAIIQIVDDTFKEETIWQTNDKFTMGDWVIKAALGKDEKAAISIVNEKTGTLFSYGYDATLGGVDYPRSVEDSSILVDTKQGSSQVQEIGDAESPLTRGVE